jgi:glucose-1-phosphate adenylyltransferase
LDHGADLTVATVRVDREAASRFGVLEVDTAYRVVGFEEKPAEPRSTLGSMGIYVFNADVLHEVLADDHDRAGSRHDFGGDIVPEMVKTHRVYAFPYLGYWVDVGTIEAYWQAHMDLVSENPRLDLLDREWVIHTRSEERPPVNIRADATVDHSLIADGCIIEGTVEHSVLSPGVTVRRGTVVRHSVVMTDTMIEEAATVDHAVLDKRIRVGAGAQVGVDGASRPSEVSEDPGQRLTVVGKNTRVPSHMRIGRNCTIAADLRENAFDFEKNRVPSGASVGVVDG